MFCVIVIGPVRCSLFLFLLVFFGFALRLNRVPVRCLFFVIVSALVNSFRSNVLFLCFSLFVFVFCVNVTVLCYCSCYWSKSVFLFVTLTALCISVIVLRSCYGYCRC